jgi:sulfite oxidase
LRDAAASPDAAAADASGFDASEEGGSLDARLPNSGSCEPFLTPLSTFFAQHGGQGTVPDWQQPDLDADTHRLAVDGEVATPLSLSLSELEAMTPQITVLKTMQCVSRLHGTALYGGVPLRTVLDAAGIVRDRTRRFRFYGADGFGGDLRVEDVYPSTGPDAEQRFEPMLALHIDGQRLPRGLGRPVRLLLADRFGFKNVKWLTRIEATRSDDPVGDYYMLGIASDEGVIVPNTWYRGEHRVQAGPAGAVTLCGHALSGFDGIASVEVALDDGEFRPARIVSLAELLGGEPRLHDALQVQEGWDYPFVGVKAPWELDLEVSAGEHVLTVRITDRSGAIGDGFRAVLTFDDDAGS